MQVTVQSAGTSGAGYPSTPLEELALTLHALVLQRNVLTTLTSSAMSQPPTPDLLTPRKCLSLSTLKTAPRCAGAMQRHSLPLVDQENSITRHVHTGARTRPWNIPPSCANRRLGHLGLAEISRYLEDGETCETDPCQQCYKIKEYVFLGKKGGYSGKRDDQACEDE